MGEREGRKGARTGLTGGPQTDQKVHRVQSLGGSNVCLQDV